MDAGVLASLEDLAGDDREFLPGLVRDFLAHAERAVVRARAAVAAGDAATVRDAAHGLKGSAGSLGARDLSALCAALDGRARAGVVEGLEADLDRIAREVERVRERLAPLLARGGGGRP